MALYKYRASDSLASLEEGTLVADSPRHARDLLRERGLTIESIEVSQSKKEPSYLTQRNLRSKTQPFIRELSTLLSVGIPLVEALDTLIRQEKGQFHDHLKSLRERVAMGESLAQAMEGYPWLFDSLVISVTQVGEEAGRLEEVLTELTDFRERASELKGKIGNALLYPAIVLSMALSISVLLMTVVVPNILAPLIESGAALPWVTQVVKSISDFLVGQWALIILSILGLSFLTTLFLKSEMGKRIWHKSLLKIPYLGSLTVKQNVVSVSVTLSTLVRSGVELLDALDIAQRSVRNVWVRSALLETSEAIKTGKDLGEALNATQVFPPTVIQVFSLGQESGQLEDMLERLARDYDRQVYTAGQRFASVLEPVMVLVLALIVGFIAFATILPILEAGNVL